MNENVITMMIMIYLFIALLLVFADVFKDNQLASIDIDCIIPLPVSSEL